RRVQPSDRCGTPASPEGSDGPFSYSSERANGKHTRRVLLVADVSVHRDSLVEQLDREPGILVVGATSDHVQSVAEYWNLSPDLVLLDVAAEERVPAIGALVAAIPEVKVVAFAVPETESDIIACAEAGVAACVTREASFDELVATIERVGSGESLCSPQGAALLLRRVRAPRRWRRGGAPLLAPGAAGPAGGRPRAGRRAPGRAGRVADEPRAGDPRSHRRRALEQADRSTPLHRGADREEPRPQSPREAPSPQQTRGRRTASETGAGFRALSSCRGPGELVPSDPEI